ncbi:MAG: MFS transporter [Nodosilinea sp.]
MSTAPEATCLEKWGGPIGLCLTLFMLSYTIGAVQPMMPAIVREFGSSVGFVQSALVLMSLVTASFTPTAENLSRRLGRKTVFGWALVVFAIGLGVMVASPSISLFTVGLAAFTGLAAAVLASTAMAFIDYLYDGKAEQYGLLALTIAGVVGNLAGSLLGGFLAFNLHWRWTFGLELALVPVIWLLVRRITMPAPNQEIAVDWVAGLLSLGGFGLTLVGVSLAGDLGWWQAKGQPQPLSFLLAPFGISVVPLLISTGLICLGLLVVWQRQRLQRGESSLLRMGVFHRRFYLTGLSIGTLNTMVTVGVMFNLFQFVPAVVGLNPFQTAIAVMPFTIAQLVVLILLVKRRLQFPPRYLLQIGLGVKSIGIAMLFGVISPTVNSLWLLPALVVMGVGTGVFMAYITSLTFAATAEHEKVEARGVYRPFQNLGASLGRGILGTLLVTLASFKIVDGIIADLGQAVSPEVRRSAIRTLQVSIQTLTRAERTEFFAQLPASIQPSLDSILEASAVEAMKATLLVILGLSLLCLGLSFLLPKTAKKFEAPID